jgi:hypothetical protein
MLRRMALVGTDVTANVPSYVPPKGGFLQKPQRRNIPEDGFLHSHRRENLKSFMKKAVFWYVAPLWLL